MPWECCSYVKSARIKEITPIQIETIDDFYPGYFSADYKAKFFVEFEMSYFFDNEMNQTLSGFGSGTYFYLIKNSENDIWKICGLGM